MCLISSPRWRPLPSELSHRSWVFCRPFLAPFDLRASYTNMAVSEPRSFVLVLDVQDRAPALLRRLHTTSSDEPREFRLLPPATAARPGPADRRTTSRQTDTAAAGVAALEHGRIPRDAGRYVSHRCTFFFLLVVMLPWALSLSPSLGLAAAAAAARGG